MRILEHGQEQAQTKRKAANTIFALSGAIFRRYGSVSFPIWRTRSW